jgi:hypothetical protein
MLADAVRELVASYADEAHETGSSGHRRPFDDASSP